MDLISIPANPVPEDVVTGMLKARDGVSIRFARWHPPPGRKGTVCLFQGRAEFIEKYFETVRELRARGFAVATMDWRGQGGSDRALSDPRKGHAGDFAEYERDVEVLMKEVVLPDCPPPIFAIGHSMGGTVLLRVARQGSRWFDRIVLSAPMIRLSGKRKERRRTVRKNDLVDEAVEIDLIFIEIAHIAFAWVAQRTVRHPLPAPVERCDREAARTQVPHGLEILLDEFGAALEQAHRTLAARWRRPAREPQ